MAARSESRRGTHILWAAVHTNEGNNPADVFPDRTAENLAGYLDRENAAGRYKSYHRICDDDSTVVYVPDAEAAWALPGGGNLPGLQLCFTGWAAWSRAEWLAHRGMLLRGAQIVRGWCDAYALHRVHLTPAQVAAGHRGVIGHADWTRSGTRRGNHTDPGPNFPWDVFMAMVNNEGEDDMTPDQARMLAEVHHELTQRLPSRSQYATEPRPTDTVLGAALNADARAHEALTELRQLKAVLPDLFAEEIRTAIADGTLDVTITVRDRATSP